MRERAASLRADLSLVAVAAVWGLTFAAVQRALEEAGPMSFLAARFSLAAAALALTFRGRALRVSATELRSAALLAIWLTAGYGLQTRGLLHTTASKSAFITGLSVVLVPMLSFALSRAVPRLSSAVAVLLAAVGLYLMTAPGAGQFNFGDLLTLGCAAAFALHIATAERVAPRHDPVPLAFWQIALTAAASALLMGTTETPRLAITPWTVAALLVTGVLATAAAFAVQMWAQRETSATHVAVIFTGEPVFAAIFARVVQREVLGPAGLLGGALIVGGMLVAQLGAGPRPAPPTEAGGELTGGPARALRSGP